MGLLIPITIGWFSIINTAVAGFNGDACIDDYCDNDSPLAEAIPFFLMWLLFSKLVIPAAIKTYWRFRGIPYDIYSNHWTADKFVENVSDWVLGFVLMLGLISIRWLH